MRRLGRNPIVVLLVFSAVSAFLIQSGWDWIVRGVVWVALLGVSAVAIFKMIRVRHVLAYGIDATIPTAIRRWVFDEPESDEAQPNH